MKPQWSLYLTPETKQKVEGSMDKYGDAHYEDADAEDVKAVMEYMEVG